VETGVNSDLAVVVIGRNEGRRLIRCLGSLKGHAAHVVYVDSGSTDGSVEAARELGVDVVELDRSRPFTAARGRNAGFAKLLDSFPNLTMVQFIDGDCEIDAGWLEAATTYLEANADVAAVAGRRRERHPDASPYNQLADMEWNTAVGEASAFGGDVMIRASILGEAGGYDESLVAGEDPDLSFRIRRAGHRIVRIDEEMTVHDAHMHRFNEFWRRQVRAGHAYAELLQLHGRLGDRTCVRPVLSIVSWGGLLPAGVVVSVSHTSGLSLGLLVLYPALWLRIFRGKRREGNPGRHAALYASSCIVGKFAALQGVMLFVWTRFLRRKQSTLIEYKGAESTAAGESMARPPSDSSPSEEG